MQHSFSSLLRRSLGLLAGAAALMAVTPAQAATRWEILHSIHKVENPNNSAKPGPHGELGAYQFRSEVWQSHTKTPFSRAVDRETSDEVAVKHFEWVKANLVRYGIEPSTYNIALVWNAGIGAVVSGRISAATRDYAERVCNLVEDLEKRMVAKR